MRKKKSEELNFFRKITILKRKTKNGIVEPITAALNKFVWRTPNVTKSTAIPYPNVPIKKRIYQSLREVVVIFFKLISL